MGVTNTVAAAVGVVAGTTLFRLVRQNQIKGNAIRILVFAGMLWSALLVVAIASPVIANTLAYLSMVGAFIVNGPEILKWLGDFGR